MMEKQQTLEILAFTDPVCTWCWGCEPVLRKLSLWYGEQVRITPVMGGLVKDIRDFHDHANGIGGDPEKANAQIAGHWVEASSRHGMPVQTEGFRLFSPDVVSTYPQNIVYKAVELSSPALAARFLRRVREASAAEARETGRQEVLIELANDVGVDMASLMAHLEDGSAAQAFRDDLATTRRYLVRGFPTFLLRWGSKELLLRGYQSFASFRAVISSLSDGQVKVRVPDKSVDAIMDFLKDFGRSAPIELTTAFDISVGELESLIQKESARKTLRYESAGNGGYWALADGGAMCDPTTCTCTA